MRHRLLYGILVAALALALGGCDESQNCPTNDAGPEDSGTDGGDADPPLDCQIPEVSCDDGEHAEYSLCIDDSEEIEISGGTFDMGAPSGDEFPEHEVTLGDYVIDQTEVNNARYASCVEAGCCTPPSYDGSYSGREPYYGNSSYNNHPVIFVSWEQARQYCEGLGKRLATEAQWEYAARGDDGRLFPWGNSDPSSRIGNFNHPLDGDTSAVGEFDDGASPFGLMDMAGNVWEWVADWYDADYYDDSPSNDPTGPENGVMRVARGGSFGSGPAELYSFYRVGYLPSETYSNVGFRCVR